jgi:ankyrin repeat protein
VGGVSQGDIKRTQELLLQRADVETSVDKGATPYMLACAAGAPVPLLELLERHGANVLATDSTGATALILAAFKVHGLTPGGRGGQERAASPGAATPQAASVGRRVHADTSRTNLAGCGFPNLEPYLTPPAHPSPQGNLQVVRHLLGRPDPAGKAGEGASLLRARTGKGETALMAAAKSAGADRAAVVTALLSAGADATQRATGAGDATAMHVAAARDAVDVMQLLLAHGEESQRPLAEAMMPTDGGAVVLRDAVAADGATPLLRAAASGARGAMDLLVAAGALPPEQADKRGYLALHVAAAAGQCAAVDHILDRTAWGLSVDCSSHSKAGCAVMTPLACAAVAGQVSLSLGVLLASLVAL